MTGNWGGTRTWLEDNGINFSMIWTGVYQQNFRGGLETHNAEKFPGDFRLNLAVDFDKMGLIPGGFLFIRGKSMWDDGLRADVSSLRSTSWALDGGCQPFYADKYWYSQRFLENKVEFRIGNLLTPDLFDNAVYASDIPWDQFLNQNLSINSTVPHTRAYGAYMQIKPTDWFYFSMAAVDADQRRATRSVHFDTAFHEDARFIGLWEIGLTSVIRTEKGNLPGNYKFGWWYDPRVGQRFEEPRDDERPPTQRGDDVGFYVTFDQLLFKEHDDPLDRQGLGLFFRYGYAHRDINLISNYWEIGFQYEGLFPDRDKDRLGFGVAQNILSSRYRHNVNDLADRETNYEIYYAIYVTPWCVISPDIQVITNPGGNKDARDALIGGLRMKITF